MKRALLLGIAALTACGGGGGSQPSSGPVPPAAPPPVAAPASPVPSAPVGAAPSSAPSAAATSVPAPARTSVPTAAPTATPAQPAAPPKSLAAIKHIVVIVQENRSFDNLFMGFPGADTVASAPTHTGATVPLIPISLTVPSDVDHSHRAFLTDYDKGKLDGFDLAGSGTFFSNGVAGAFPIAYVPRDEVQPYWDLASRYTLADRMFQSNSGPSYPAHLFLIAGQSGFAAENPSDVRWGCESAPSQTVSTLNPDGSVGLPISPCQDFQTLGDRLDRMRVSWRYYAPNTATGADGGGVWSAYSAVRHIRFGLDWTNNISSPETNVLTDIAGGNLAQVTYVVPSAKNSDHSGFLSKAGPQWVATVVNALGKSPYWNDTAILITWDDWGGWYDHVAPAQLDALGLGFRVPLIAVGPYAKRSFVAHAPYEFGSILHFIEDQYGLTRLSTSDTRARSVAELFDVTQAPAPFVPVTTTIPAGVFAQERAVGPEPDR